MMAKKMTPLKSEESRVNRGLIQGWTTIAAVLFFAYLFEVVKGSRTMPYFIVFSLLLIVPVIAAHLMYRKNSEDRKLHFFSAVAYTALYVFVLLTGNTMLSFVYIFPMLFIYMSFNNTKIIARVGAVMILANLLFVAYAALTNPAFREQSASYEIQVAAAVLCAVFAYISIKVSNYIFTLRSERLLEDERQQREIIASVGRVSETVKEDTDRMLDGLTHLQSASERTYGAMDEIVGGMHNANDMIEVQMTRTADIQASIREAEGLTEQITDMVNDTKDRIGSGRENMKKLMESAARVENGSQVVSEQMEELQQMTVEMKEIINIISNIAGKTNLLALNASIEAARAGEAGRGFSVVAEQITQLASQTKRATENITEMVGALSDKAAEASRVVIGMAGMNREQNSVIYEAEQAFVKIDEGVSGVRESMNAQTECMKTLVDSNKEIVESVHTLSAISEEITANSQQTQEVARKNAEIAEHMDTLAKDLAGATDDLYRQVNADRN